MPHIIWPRPNGLVDDRTNANTKVVRYQSTIPLPESKQDNGEEDHGVDDSNQLLEKTNHSHMIMSLQCNHFSLSGGLED